MFLSLLIYILIWPVYVMVIAPMLGITSIFIMIAVPFILFFFSCAISGLIIYLIHSFNPEFKPAVRNIVRLPGVKWIAFSTVIAGVFSLFAITINHGLNYASFGLFIPVIIVSLLNALNIEKNPKMLEDEQIAPKLVTLPRPVPQEVEKDMVRSFTWAHKGHEYGLSLVVRKSVYDDYKSKARAQFREWASEYVAGGICGEVRELAFKLMQIGKPYGTYEEVSFVLSFVQQALKYERDEGEYPRYPVESIIDGIGDCEDFSILGAGILKLMGYEVALLFLPGHAALGVAGAADIPGIFAEHQDTRYYYCEMTASGWQIGQLPEDHKNEKIEVYPVPGVIIEISDSSAAAAG
ncbi:MAG: hypothetical protein JW943_08250 [Deltaproteobacteria bacterium]|nr:hypothetical protein [Deltaproteobacteria bacterium]